MTSHDFASFIFVQENGDKITATRHINPDGSLGGLVAANASVAPGAYVEPGAIVQPGVLVRGDERILAEKILSVEEIR